MVLLVHTAYGGQSRMSAVFTTHRALKIPTFTAPNPPAQPCGSVFRDESVGRLGEKPRQGEVVLMEKNTQDELKAHLMATSEEFRSLAERHAEYHKQLEQLEAKPHLTLEDEAEEQRLKKQKLRLKDQMNEILARYRAQRVA